MQFRIHGQNFQTLAYLDNDSVDYTLVTANMTEYKEEATKTLELRLQKNDVGNRIIQEGGFVSFRYKGHKLIFHIVQVEETKTEIRIDCDFYSNELLNETCPPYKGEPSRSLIDHLKRMPFNLGKDIILGVNEVAGQTLHLEYTSTANKLSRLISVCGHFDAIPKIRIAENRAGGNEHFIVDVFKRDNFGRKRYDVVISDDDLDDFSYSVDMTEIYTAISPISEEHRLTGSKLWHDKSGNIEFEQQNGLIYAKQAADRYPAFKSIDKWIVHHQEFSVESEGKLQSEALKALKANCYPKTTIKAKGKFQDFEIGDNVTVNLKNVGSYGFLGKMSVSKMTTDLLSDDIQDIEFSDFSRVASKISKQAYQAQQDILIAPNYNVEFSSDNGTVFKNGQGQTVLKYLFTKDNAPATPFRVEWLKGQTTISLEETATVSASDLVDDKLVISLRVYTSASNYIEKQITLTNVNDGQSGPFSGIIGGRNLALETSSSWSSEFTGFNGRENQGIYLYKMSSEGLKVGDTLRVRIELEHSNITSTSGKTGRIALQANGNVTGWSSGMLYINKWHNLSGSGTVVMEFVTLMTEHHLRNKFWFLRFRQDWIASGSIRWRAVKAEKGDVFTDWTPAPEDATEAIATKLPSSAVKLEDNGTVTKAGTVVTGDTYATMIAGNPEWAQKIGNTIRVNGNMLVQGAVTADKLSVDNLSAVTANMGTITGGKLFLSETYQNPNSGEVSLGSVSMGNGELRFQVFNQTKGIFKDIFIDGNMIDVRQRSSLVAGAVPDSVVQISPNSIQVIDNKGGAQSSGKQIHLTNDNGFMKMQADYIKQTTRVTKEHAFPYGVQGYFVRIGDMVTVSFFRRIARWQPGENRGTNITLPYGFRPVVETNVILIANVGQTIQSQGIFHLYPDGRITSTGHYNQNAVWSGSMSWVTSDNMPIVDVVKN